MTTLATATRVDLETGCSQACAEFTHRLVSKLDTPHYTQGVSIMRCPASLLEWEHEHRTARKRAWRSSRLGYRFDEVDMSLYAEDRYRINTSLTHRQGRPMADGYRSRYQPARLPHYPCERHRIHTYGVIHGTRLVAYSTLYRAGELALISMIIGHGDHLRGDIMYLLAARMFEAHPGAWFYYNRHDSGTEGLVYFKERLGFRAADIEWVL